MDISMRSWDLAGTVIASIALFLIFSRYVRNRVIDCSIFLDPSTGTTGQGKYEEESASHDSSER